VRAPENKRADAVLEHHAGSNHNHPLMTKGHVMAIDDSTGSRGGLNIAKQVADLRQMTARELRDKYAEVVGEQARSSHKNWLIRRIAWRLQADHEGDLSERARRRAAELANDADVRVTPPRDQRGDTGRGTSADAARDERLPTDTIERTYKGRLIRVIVRGSSFEYDGRRYKSLSAVAKAISGSHCNGFRFFGLEGKR